MKRFAAKKPGASLGTLAAVVFLGCSDAFLAPTTIDASPPAPAKREAGRLLSVPTNMPDRVRSRRSEISAFGGVGWGWGRVKDRTALPDLASHGVGSRSVTGDTTSDKEEDEPSVAMPSVHAHGEGEMTIEEPGEEVGGGGEVEGKEAGVGWRGRGRWKNRLHSAKGAVSRVFPRGGSPAAAGGDQVAVTTLAPAASSLISKLELPPGGRVTPPAIVTVNTRYVQRPSNAMAGDHDIDRKQRVLILMSDTGGGHRASAEALEAAFNQLYPGMLDVDIVDIWTDHASWPLNTFVGAYQFMAKRPLIWKALFEYGRFPPARKLSDEFMNIRCHKRFQGMFQEYKPDLVVSVHPLCQEVPLRVLKNMGGGMRQIPFVTVVTDLGGAHPTWFHRDVDACFVPSERLLTLAGKCGLAPDQIRLHGLPIRSGFSREQPAEKTELQVKLGLKQGVKTCLVMGGGDGVGRLEGIAESLGHRLGQEKRETQVVVVCGKNEAVRASLEGADWPSNVHMHVKGFVSNMDEWMGAVDCIVTKAGPGTIAEATTRGLPVMLSNFLPGQEAGNVPFVIEGGFGAFNRKPKKIAETVCTWLGDDNLLARMSFNAKKASRPMATFEICRDIGEMLFKDDFVLEVPGRSILVLNASPMER
eukprot:jgi/Undpi1/13247/HiC_scaffold_8.g02909.m1